MPPALVIFDMIGTTIDGSDRVAALFAAVAAEAGLTASDVQLQRVRGLNKADAFLALARAGGRSGAVADSLAAGMHARFRAGLERDLALHPPREIAGARQTLEWLAVREIPAALTSGLDREFVDAVLAHLGWTRALVATAVCGGDVERGRPAPDLIFEAMRRTGVTDAAAVVAVGDTVADLEAAAAAGVGAGVGVLSGAGRQESLQAAPHAAILPSVADLPAWLASRATR